MIIDLEILKQVYEHIKETDYLNYINEYVGLEENETASFEDFKDYVASNIIASLQYDFNVRIDLHNLVKDVK